MLISSVVLYSIQTNIGFTLGYILPDSLPIYYLPKRLLINFLIAFALATGVNFFMPPWVNSRTVFLVHQLAILLTLAFFPELHERGRDDARNPQHLHRSAK